MSSAESGLYPEVCHPTVQTVNFGNGRDNDQCSACHSHGDEIPLRYLPQHSMAPRLRSRTTNLNVVPVFHHENVETDQSSDDDRSGDFFPGGLSVVEDGHTPPRRTSVRSSIAPSQRIAARISDPNRGRCFLTNQDSDMGVEACHIVRRATSQNTVCLCWIWL